VNSAKQLSAKKAWGALSERARFGENFGFIACLALLYKLYKLYKANLLTKSQVTELLNAQGITREDLQKFREQRLLDLRTGVALERDAGSGVRAGVAAAGSAEFSEWS
jgi:hypothetical protein